MRRYERALTLITTNRSVEDWGMRLGDTAAAGTIAVPSEHPTCAHRRECATTHSLGCWHLWTVVPCPRMAGCQVSRGEEGIGVFSEDPLGLNVVYLQAKRWDGS